MNVFLKVLLSSACFLIVSSAYADDTTACFPPCRAGYVCFHGHCIEQCNPPCPATMQCNSKSECVPIEEPAAPGSMTVWHKKYRKHTGFYLAFNLGYDFGVNSTTGFPDYSGVNDYTFSGSGGMFCFLIGGAIKENLILFADFPSVADIIAPVIKINGSVQPGSTQDITVDSRIIGAGIMYYIMPYNVFISASIGPAYAVVNGGSSSSDNYYSDFGFGARVRAGKEWWVSRRWALGAAGIYQFTTQNSGDFFILKGRMKTSMIGICFSATLN